MMPTNELTVTFLGREFVIRVDEVEESGYSYAVTELGDTVSQPGGYTYREQYEWEGTDTWHANRLDAFRTALGEIITTLEDEVE